MTTKEVVEVPVKNDLHGRKTMWKIKTVKKVPRTTQYWDNGKVKEKVIWVQEESVSLGNFDSQQAAEKQLQRQQAVV